MLGIWFCLMPFSVFRKSFEASLLVYTVFSHGVVLELDLNFLRGMASDVCMHILNAHLI